MEHLHILVAEFWQSDSVCIEAGRETFMAWGTSLLKVAEYVALLDLRGGLTLSVPGEGKERHVWWQDRGSGRSTMTVRHMDGRMPRSTATFEVTDESVRQVDLRSPVGAPDWIIPRLGRVTI